MKRVVIVEDNESVAKFFRYVLEHNATYTVVIAESGNHAVGLAREPDTVAVLVDVSLRATQYEGRYVDGIELSRILKEDQQTSRVPVIIATAHVMSGDRERFLRESRADGFVRKPVVDPQDLPEPPHVARDRIAFPRRIAEFRNPVREITVRPGAVCFHTVTVPSDRYQTPVTLRRLFTNPQEPCESRRLSNSNAWHRACPLCAA